MSQKVSRKKKHEEHENHERWLVSYADFITLLFAFFVVLYATSSQNEEKEKKFEESIRAEMKMAVVGSSGKSGGNSGAGSDNNLANNAIAEAIKSNAGLSNNTINTNPIDLFQKQNVGNAELLEHVQKLLDENLEKSEKEKIISNVRHDNIGVKISLSASAFFPSGSPKLKYQALKSLDKIAIILKKSNRKLIIEGHTDDQPIIGHTYDSNWELARDFKA
jgi:chemotaxis protein MotB